MNYECISVADILVQRNTVAGFNSKFFNRTYEEYENGFGNESSLYWIGLKSLHRLTQNNTCSARFILQDTDGIWYTEEYVTIVIGNSSVGYQIHINGFQGNASDAMTINDDGIFVVSCFPYFGGFWANGDCMIPAGINFVSSPRDFGWTGPFGGGFSLIYSEFWLMCYNN